MSKHTPGPWKANFAISQAAYIFGGDRNFARVYNEWQDEANQEANARLIAAAPDLLAALKEAELVLAEKLRRLGADPNVSPTTHRIRAAIAKATGEQA